MDVLTFTVPGTARGKGRPRIGKIGPHARMFTDDKTAAYENLVALAAREALRGAKPFADPVKVTAIVRVVPAASASKKARAAMLAGAMAPGKKPDLDNVLKAILDGLNGVAFVDDALIVQIAARKLYAEEAGVDVSIKPALAQGAAA